VAAGGFMLIEQLLDHASRVAARPNQLLFRGLQLLLIDL